MHGGCAITHAAMLSGKFREFVINDITDTVILFDDAVHGKYKDERRWISRDDFYRLKDTDPYVRYVWSFGNNGNNYLYSKEIEELKHALHDVHFSTNEAGRSEAMKRYYTERAKITDKRKRTYELQSLEALQRLEGLERLQRLESLNSKHNLRSSQRDYREVEIKEDSVVYCDPPYKDTDGYNNDSFDHDAFYDWCVRQSAPLFISEYSIPSSEFVCIAEFTKASLLHNGHNERKYVTEKLYRPRRQIVG